MLNAVDFTSADPLAQLQASLGDFSGVTNVSLTYTGSEDAIFEAEGFSIDSTSGGTNYTYGDGVLLSSGGAPGMENTVSGYTVNNGEPGDADLTAQAQAAYAGAGESNDAAILEVQFDVPEGADFSSVSFNVGFGSDEYPEYNNTSYVDIGATFVNGQNYAVFNNDPSKLLSVQSNSIGDFVDNESDGWAIEYDGFSPLLNITAPVQEGTNVLKLGVADTGDYILDSGLFVGGIDFGTSSATGAFVPVGGSESDDSLEGDDSPELFDAGAGSDVIAPGLGTDYISTGAGADIVTGTPLELDGDIISDFDVEDLLVFEEVLFGMDDVTITMGSAIFDIDTDGDGEDDTQLTMEGDFEDAEFEVTNDDASTSIALSDDTDNGDAAEVGDDTDNGDAAEVEKETEEDDDDAFGGMEILLLLGLAAAAALFLL